MRVYLTYISLLHLPLFLTSPSFVTINTSSTGCLCNCKQLIKSLLPNPTTTAINLLTSTINDQDTNIPVFYPSLQLQPISLFHTFYVMKVDNLYILSCSTIKSLICPWVNFCNWKFNEQFKIYSIMNMQILSPVEPTCLTGLYFLYRSNVMSTVPFKGNIPIVRFKWILLFLFYHMSLPYCQAYQNSHSL